MYLCVEASGQLKFKTRLKSENLNLTSTIDFKPQAFTYTSRRFTNYALPSNLTDLTGIINIYLIQIL